MNILETTDLKKYYGTEPNITKALDGVTLSIEHWRNISATNIRSDPGRIPPLTLSEDSCC